MKKDDFIISEVRKFNRFYTNVLGLLNQSILDSPYSLTEVRILLEISGNENCTAVSLIEKLDVDRGYMSRILNRFESDELIIRENSYHDGRVLFLRLTSKGKKVLSILEEKSSNQIRRLINNLTDEQKEELVESIRVIITLLSSGLNTSDEDNIL